MLGLLITDVPLIVAWGGYGMAGYAVLSLLVIARGRFRENVRHGSEESAG
jgi:hypothetical protein